MAYYEYECKDCGEKFSVKQSFDEHDREPSPECPKCHSHEVSQELESVHVVTSKKS